MQSPRAMAKQLTDLMEQFERTGEHDALGKCVEHFTQRLPSSLDGVELAEPKGMDTLQAAREVQKCLDVYERALEKMEEARMKYERLDMCDTTLRQGGTINDEDCRHYEARSAQLTAEVAEAESLVSELSAAVAQKEAENDELAKEIPNLAERASKGAENETEIHRVHALIEAVSAMHGVELSVDTVQHLCSLSDGSALGKGIPVHIKCFGTACLFVLAPPDLRVLDVQVSHPRASPGYLREVLEHSHSMRPPDDLRYVIQLVNDLLYDPQTGSYADELVQLKKRALVSVCGSEVTISFQSGVSAVVLVPSGYPNTPEGVLVSRVSSFAHTEGEMKRLCETVNALNASSLTAAVEALTRLYI